MNKREMLDEVAYRLAKVGKGPNTIENRIKSDVLDDLWVYLFTHFNEPKRCGECKQTIPVAE